MVLPNNRRKPLLIIEKGGGTRKRRKERRKRRNRSNGSGGRKKKDGGMTDPSFYQRCARPAQKNVPDDVRRGEIRGERHTVVAMTDIKGQEKKEPNESVEQQPWGGRGGSR